jgi:hypothetical protein
MTDFDPYSQKVADICTLIRQHGKCEEWELFKNSERGLEVLCAIVDAVREEAKAAVQPGYALVPLEPTEKMLTAMDLAFTWVKAMEGVYPSYYSGGDKFSDHRDAYKAMLSAASIAAVAEQTGQEQEQTK